MSTADDTVQVVQHRVVRPDGSLLYTFVTTSQMPAPLLLVDEWGWIYLTVSADGMVDEDSCVAPPWRWETRDQDGDWTTVTERLTTTPTEGTPR